MAVLFLEPGGDADFGIGFWQSSNGTPTAATDFVHGGHLRSIAYGTGTPVDMKTTEIFADAGGRGSVWIYLNALPSATSSVFVLLTTASGAIVARMRITSTGVLQLWEASAQIGGNGSTLSTGTWYRLTFAWKITSTTVNEFRLFKNGVSDISVTNATITNTGTKIFDLGNASGNANLDLRTSDHYFDDSNALTDPGNIWVTAKRPNANGTTNGFTTQIGAGGSGYGTGHSPQVNERPNSDTNGWSVVGAGSAITEEYNIEAASVGDINIAGATIVDYMGWVRSKALVSETAQIIVNNVNSNIALTSTTAFFTKVAGSSTYPAGTGTDIGEITSTTVTTVSLYEAGIIVAYIPAVGGNDWPTMQSRGFLNWRYSG